jgi:phage terminase large subunit-like protein
VKQIESLDNSLDKLIGLRLTPDQEKERWLCENSFYLFVEKAWPVIEGGKPFIPGWHVQAICEHMEALYKLEITRLIINIPPRMGKSNLCSVLFVAWVWAKDPSLSFLYSSYANSLSVRDSVKCRRLIQSDWYQSLWADKFSLMSDVNNKLRFDNDYSGYRIASSVGGTNTGLGAHFEISDDPNSVNESESEVIRESTNEWHDFVMSTRYAGTMSQFRRLVVQQRTHMQDVSGNILSKDSRWIHLCLPMEFEKTNRCKTIPLRTSNGKVWRDPRTKEGELLWPAGINAQQLYDLKNKDFRGDPYRIAGQLQQRPSPAEGGIIQSSWYQLWKENDLPQFEYVLQSWDTAMAGESKNKSKNASICYSACTTWGIFSDKNDVKNIMLLSIYKGKIEYPDLKKMALRLAHNWYDTDFDYPITQGYPSEKSPYSPDLVLIESKVSGYTLASDLMRTTIPIMRFNPNTVGNKETRAKRVTDLIENGRVWLPCDPPSFYPNEYSQLLIKDSILFPNNESNDTIDSMSQAFIRLKQTGWVFHSEDYNPPQEFDWSRYGSENYRANVAKRMRDERNF